MGLSLASIFAFKQNSTLDNVCDARTQRNVCIVTPTSQAFDIAAIKYKGPAYKGLNYDVARYSLLLPVVGRRYKSNAVDDDLAA